MRTGKLKTLHSKPMPIVAKPVRDYSQHIRLMILGGNCKPGDTVRVHPKHLQAALFKARENGYILRGPGGIDSDTVVLAPVVDLNLPIVCRSGNPGRKVIEIRSGVKYLSVKQAAIKCGVSEQSIRMSVKNSTSVRGLMFKHDEISN